MKKGVKVTLIVVPLIIILLSTTYTVTLAYSQDKVTYEVGDPYCVPGIIQITYLNPPYYGYAGFVMVRVPLTIQNDGYYGVHDVTISSKAYGQNFNFTSPNGKLLAEGSEMFDVVKPKASWTGFLVYNITSEIPYLALGEGEIRIEVEVSFNVQFLFYETPYTSEETFVEIWEPPYSDFPDTFP